MTSRGYIPCHKDQKETMAGRPQRVDRIMSDVTDAVSAVLLPSPLPSRRRYSLVNIRDRVQRLYLSPGVTRKHATEPYSGLIPGPDLQEAGVIPPLLTTLDHAGRLPTTSLHILCLPSGCARGHFVIQYLVIHP
ncbi:hypothetical protein J6590_039275 [Homalodisca vitripennis]|nr:hypothetical protein J6590_039275 [Homalodisca vitripennis]